MANTLMQATTGQGRMAGKAGRKAGLAVGMALLIAAAPCCAAVAQVAQAPAPQAAAAPQALVIGNTEYAGFPRLGTCEVSATLVASVLSRAGFKVSRQSNPSNARLGAAIAALGEDASAAPGSRSLIYVCGYAVTYADRLFLVPTEARLEREADVLSQGIVARLLMSSVAGAGAGAGLVLMDVAPPPGRGTLDFASMLRSGDAAHGGLAAATVPTTDAQRPAPLAGALADLASPGSLELRAALQGIGAQPGIGRALLFARPPVEVSWLLGGPVPVAPVPVAEARTAPVATPVPPIAPLAAPLAAPTAAPVPADPNPADRRRIQLALQRLGYFPGRVDGAFGPDTTAAIRQFQRDSNTETSGKLTASQVEQLLK